VPDFPIAHADSVRQRLEDAEKNFTESLAQDAGAAVLAKADHEKQTRRRADSGLSRSADLAYEYGEYSSEHANVTEHGIYLSIWQLDPSSEWRLMLDLQKKAPPGKK